MHLIVPVQLPTVFWERIGRFPAWENICFRMIRGEANGTILEAAAAHPTAPTGAENQDNFIAIIGLTLSLSLPPMEMEKGGARGEKRSVCESSCIETVSGKRKE